MMEVKHAVRHNGCKIIIVAAILETACMSLETEST